jgi:hypothetical protein
MVVMRVADGHDIRRAVVFLRFDWAAGFIRVDDYPNTFFRGNQERRYT